MKHERLLQKCLSAVLCLALIAAMALTFTACTDTASDATSAPTSSASQPTALGKGATAFNLQVVDKDGRMTAFVINTDETTVGAALQKVDLIEGEMGDYGLYLKTVNGITADYDADKTYWAFYIGGEYAMTGVDQTDVVAGETYVLKVES